MEFFDCKSDDKITQIVAQMMDDIEIPQQPLISPSESLLGLSGHMSSIVSPTNSGGNGNNGDQSNKKCQSIDSVPRTKRNRCGSGGNSSKGRRDSTGYSTSSIVEVYSPCTRQILSVFKNTTMSDRTAKQFLDYFDNYNRYKRDERLAKRDERLAKLQYEVKMVELLAKHGNKKSVKNFMQNHYNRK
ncbi:uncharacterized protein LOC129576373 [Sitodiplosis mosellana]|uniref:uncharacterized protein LOC129576373 n=1 Tax=Sitodiplosis mosellana TaxID=263140 RepID=UPI002443CE54|nr:uncharacterized protein LOC129576373 [Sitodiplosis mosellana]